MLQTGRHSSPPDSEQGGEPSLSEVLDRALGTIKRQFPIFIAILCCTFLLSFVYLFTTPPRYTATATMVIDTHKVQLLEKQSVVGDNVVDAGTVQTEVEIVKSSRVLQSVLEQLHLSDDPEFTEDGGGIFGFLSKFIPVSHAAEAEKTPADLVRQTLASLKANFTAGRVGNTYTIEISFRSLDPAKAVRIANAIADAYISDQLEAKYQVTRRAGVWLQSRIKELRTEVSAAERAVVEFREKNNIVAAAGKLVNEQQLAEVNTQLILAHAGTAEAKARLERMQQVLREPLESASVADALKNEIIVKLRTQYLEFAAREAIWKKKYGSDHLAVINLRTQMTELRHNIEDEMRKISESYQSDYEIARTREEAIGKSLSNSVAHTSQASVQLLELESNAATYRTLYNNFLQRYMEAAQQESFPISEARIITAATKPFSKSDPKTWLVLLVTGAGGLLLSLGVAAIRETTDRVFRESKQVENLLQMNCLATFPAVRSGSAGDAAPVEATAKSAAATSAPRYITARQPILKQVISMPLSQFTESMRSVKVALDLNGILKSKKAIGFTSTLPNEGKTTMAANFARLVAHSGSRAVLVDADLRKPSLSRLLTPDAKVGLVDVLAEKCSFADVQWVDPETGLTFIPTGITSKIIHSSELLGSDKMKDLVERLNDSFDYVILDLSPLSPIVDVRMTTQYIDSYVFVVEWGRTKIQSVMRAISAAREIQDRILGVVLNKADQRVLGRYDSYHSRSQYRKYYSHYGYVE
jgi:polysaccharide biosynthesis transport protein